MQYQNELNSSEKLSALLDGELPLDDANSLFYDLANNNELQKELYEHISLKQMFKKTLNVPPSNLKQNILSSVGFAPEVITSKWSQFTSASILKSKTLLSITSAMGGVMMTLFLMQPQQSSNDSVVGNTSQFGNISSQATDNPATPTSKTSLPIVSSVADNRQDGKLSSASSGDRGALSSIGRAGNNFAFTPASGKPSDSQASTFALERAGVNNNEEMMVMLTNIQTQEQVVSLNSSTIFLLENFYDSQVTGNANGVIKRKFVRNQINKENFENAYIESKLYFQFRAFRANSFKDLELNNVNTNSSMLSDVGLALMYEVNDNLSVGLEFGSENFELDFDAINLSTGNVQPFKQSSQRFWGGVSGRYMADPINSLGGVQPYTTFLIGTHSNGFLSRAGGGVNYNVSNSLNLFSGFELTGLYANFNGVISSSYKYGFTYGVNIKF